MVLKKLEDLENCHDQRHYFYFPSCLLKFCLQFTNLGHVQNTLGLGFLFVFLDWFGFFKNCLLHDNNKCQSILFSSDKQNKISMIALLLL